MKLLKVTPYFIQAYGYGGPVKSCFDISKELAKMGHEVTVATTDVLDEKNRIKDLEEEVDGIKIIRFKNVSNWLAKNCNGYLPIGFYSWAKKNLKNFDVVHCNDFFTYQNIVVAYFCKKYGIPFIVQPHGSLSFVRQNAKFRRTKKLFLNLFKNVLSDSRNMVALTENEKKEIILIDNSLENKIKIIPNGIKLEEFENIEKINLHEKFSIPKENKVIGYVGRIQYIKGIDISLEILAKIKERIKFTYLIMGPDGGEKEKLERKINKLDLNENVIFTGILTGKEEWETIKSCDLFLFTSRSEGLPMAILEIAALGVPQIISKNCNVPEIEKYKGGFEINLENNDLFANKILEVLSDENLSGNMSINSKKMIRGSFNFHDMIRKIKEIYN